MSDTTRRDFLERGGCLLGLLLGTGLSTRALSALPVSETAATRRLGQERRYPIPADDGVSIDRREQVILVRSDGRAYAFNLSCPHENAAVKWLAKDHRFQCSRHDSQYQPDGTYTSGRATRNMDRFPVRRDGAELVVDLSRVFHSDSDPDAWAAANVPVLV